MLKIFVIYFVINIIGNFRNNAFSLMVVLQNCITNVPTNIAVKYKINI